MKQILVMAIFILLVGSCAPQVEPGSGVTIVSVSSDSPSKIFFTAGDAILEVNQQPVYSEADIRTLLNIARKGGKKSILILLNSKIFSLRFVALRTQNAFSGVTFAGAAVKSPSNRKGIKETGIAKSRDRGKQEQ